MVLNFKPAMALVVLLTADPLSLTNAEQSRRTRLLDEQKGGVAERLAVNAEFHRAMMMDSSSSIGSSTSTAIGEDRDGPMLRGSVHAKQTASKKFAGQPHIQRMLANIRRKRALTGPVQRSVGKDKIVNGAMMEEHLVECSLSDTANADELLKGNGDADVGLFGLQSDCDDGYECIPSDASSLGGFCTMATAGSESISSTATRNLDGYYCSSGCPVELCECPLKYVYDHVSCFDANVDACLDGSYVEHCSEDFFPDYAPYQKALAQAYCNYYTCVDDHGLTNVDSMGYISIIFCDGTDPNCDDVCHCNLYASLCEPLGSICAKESDASFCTYIDAICEWGANCAEEITPDNFEEPTGPTGDPVGNSEDGGSNPFDFDFGLDFDFGFGFDLDCDEIEGSPPIWAACIPELKEIRTTSSPDMLYVYQRPATCFITNMFYYYNELSKEWFWTPYGLNDDLWMPVDTLIVPSGFWAGQIPAPPNVAIINYLEENNPNPTKSCGTTSTESPIVCVTIEGNRHGTCIDKNECLAMNKVPIPYYGRYMWTADHCKDFEDDVQCCVDTTGVQPPPLINLPGNNALGECSVVL